MEIILDTANLEEIRHYNDYYEITGVTSNPTILSKEKDPDFWRRLDKIKEIIGDKELHVQVTARDFEGMMRETEVLADHFGKEIYVKIPVNEEGLKTIKFAHKAGYRTTATAIYSAQQAMLATVCGADYLAPYYNRMSSINMDAGLMIRQTSSLIDKYGYKTKIVAASFKNVGQIMDALLSGAHAVTATPSLYRQMVTSPVIEGAVDQFQRDWESVYGKNTIDTL